MALAFVLALAVVAVFVHLIPNGWKSLPFGGWFHWMILFFCLPFIFKQFSSKRAIQNFRPKLDLPWPSFCGTDYRVFGAQIDA